MIIFSYIRRETPTKPEFIYKKLCIYSHMLKLQSPSKYSPFDTITYWDVFSTAQNSFWTHPFWCLLVLLPILFHLFHINKMFPFEEFFHLGIPKKVTWGEIGWSRAWGTVRLFLLKNCWPVWAGALLNRPSWNVGRVFKKNSWKPSVASHNNASWYTDTDGFLEHSPSRGSLYHKGPTLQKIIQFFGGSPFLCVCVY